MNDLPSMLVGESSFLGLPLDPADPAFHEALLLCQGETSAAVAR